MRRQRFYCCARVCPVTMAAANRLRRHRPPGLVPHGHVEADLDQQIYLVRFEGATGDLGPPVGCLPEELTQDQAWAKSAAEEFAAT